MAGLSLGREVTPWSGDGEGDRWIGCKGHPSSGKQKTRPPVGGDKDDDANIHNDDGDDDAGGGIARCNSMAYAGAESVGSWRDDGNRTRRQCAC